MIDVLLKARPVRFKLLKTLADHGVTSFDRLAAFVLIGGLIDKQGYVTSRDLTFGADSESERVRANTYLRLFVGKNHKLGQLDKPLLKLSSFHEPVEQGRPHDCFVFSARGRRLWSALGQLDSDRV
tara:strand:- start:4642 stop:5019 length:378 start_codon:yes stop_codon:yes gene_type:complete